jgi:protease I
VSERRGSQLHPLHGKRIAFLMANEGVEQAELTDPWEAVKHAGGHPVLIAPEAGTVRAVNHRDPGSSFIVDETVTQADSGRYDALVLPGRVANPDRLRTVPAAVRFAKAFFDAGTPVGAICHGPWTLVEADVVRGGTVTSWPSLQTELHNAGATWIDQEVVV